MAKTAQSEHATIFNSGSTNAPGFQITVYRSGRADYERTGPARGVARGADPAPTVVLAEALVARFFADLTAALPFSRYEDKGSIKSASFGFSLRVEFRGEQSPDLASPPADHRLELLAKDVGEIERAIREKGTASAR